MSKRSTLLARIQHWIASLAEPSLTVLLVLELILIFIAVPLSTLGLWPAAATILLRFALFFAALAVVSQHRPLLFIILAGLTLTAISTGRTGPVLEDPDIIAQLCLWVVLIWVVGRALFAPGRVTHHRIQGAIALYLQLALLFAYAYLLIAVRNPNAFNPPVVVGRLNEPSVFLHFSFVTLTTTGYGDMVPVHPIARSLADLEAMLGQFYIAVLLARLVTLELEHAERRV